MSVSNSSTNGDAVQSKSGFSYAQAAKGTSAPTTPSVQSAQEANSWSDEQNTSVEDQSRDHNLPASKTSDAGLSSASSTKDDKAAASSVASDLVASSVLPAKDEDNVSDVTSPSEVGQGQASVPSTSGAQTPEVTVEKETGRGRKNKKSKQSSEDKAEEVEKPAPKPLKEAPVPTVNFWQQRAQQAKTSLPSLSPTATEKSSPTSSIPKTSAQGTPTQPVRAASFPRRDEASVRAGPLLPRNDEVSWPTPISAEDEARKRAQELADKEKAHTASAKPHGKSEWKAVPYTPTVKFNTPLPALRGKGGKPGARGGRVEGATGRSPVAGQSGAPAEGAEFKPRSKSEGGVARSATLPPNSRRPETQAGAKTDATSSADVGADASKNAQGAAQAVSGAKDTTAVQEKSAAIHVETAVNGASEVNGISQTSNTSSESAPGAPASGRPRRKSQSGQNYEHTNGEKKQRGSEAGPSGDRGSWIENRERSSKGENFIGSYRGDGSQRGRGGYKAARGAHAQGIHPAMAQHGLPPVQTVGHHTKNFSNSYYPPTGVYTQQGRGSYRGGRASMPADGNFGRYGFPNGQQFGDYPYPVAAYGYPSMMPMSAFPYAPQMEQQVLISAISIQLSYYFSLENLLKDIFLRKHMDTQGFVYMSLICDFKRMKEISADNELIKFVCLQSDELELRRDAEGKDKIRKKEGWQEWVLAEAERDVTARNDGPPETEHPQASYSGVYAPTFQHPQASMEPSPMTNAGHFDHYPQPNQGFSPVPVTPSKLNGTSHPKSPSGSTEHDNATTTNETAPKSEQSLTNGTSSTKPTEADAHHNDENRDLLVAVKPINSPEAKSPHDEHPPVNGSISGERLPRLSRSPARSHLCHAAGCYWIKEGDKEKFLPLPEDADFILYDTLHEHALLQRRLTSTNGGKNYDLDILYNFWSHFLLRYFNSDMYEEFCFYAREDFENGATFGMDRLLEFYNKALMNERSMRDRIAEDYVELVTKDVKQGRGKAFMELRRAWRNGATDMRNRKKLSGFMETELREELDR